jgi:hypothetical protein
LKLQALEQHIYNISYYNAEETIGRSAPPRPTQGRSGGGAHTSVEEPTRRWSPCQWRSLHVGGARSPMEELARRWSRASVEEPTHWCRSPRAGGGAHSPMEARASGGAACRWFSALKGGCLVHGPQSLGDDRWVTVTKLHWNGEGPGCGEEGLGW